jgi:hypothetical protein
MAVFDFTEGFYNPRGAALGARPDLPPLTSSGSVASQPKGADLYSPAARGKLPHPQGGGRSVNPSAHPSTKAGQLQTRGQPSQRFSLLIRGLRAHYCPRRRLKSCFQTSPGSVNLSSRMGPTTAGPLVGANSMS